MRIYGRTVLGGVVVSGVIALGAPAHAQDGQQFIVSFREGTTAAQRAAASASAGGEARFIYRGVNAATIRVPNPQALAALQRHPAVLSIVPDRPIAAIQRAAAKKPGGGGTTPSGQITPAGVQRVGAPVPGSSDGSGIGVAILDTGIDLAHADLGGAVDAFSAFGGSCQDGDGHGTHVAGIAAARHNTIGVIGVAPAAGLYCVKVLDDSGSGSDATLMAGLDWVLDAHATVSPAIRVVNMSLGRTGTIDDNPALRDLVAAVEAAGIVIVAAAGNDSSTTVADQIPAAYPQVISVASTTAASGTNQCRFLSSPIPADAASYFTTDGAGVTVSAPGEDRENVTRGCMIASDGILSTRLGGGTTRMSGTSMAAPHVAGVAARHLQQNPAFTPAEVRTWIMLDAARRGVAPIDSPAGGYTFDGIREGVAQAP